MRVRVLIEDAHFEFALRRRLDILRPAHLGNYRSTVSCYVDKCDAYLELVLANRGDGRDDTSDLSKQRHGLAIGALERELGDVCHLAHDCAISSAESWKEER